MLRSQDGEVFGVGFTGNQTFYVILDVLVSKGEYRYDFGVNFCLAIWRDWGTGGFDNTYGRGGLYLWPYHPDTLWLSRAAQNYSDHRSYPFYTVQGASDWAVNGGRLVFLGAGSYPEPAVINRALKVETPVGGVTLGN